MIEETKENYDGDIENSPRQKHKDEISEVKRRGRPRKNSTNVNTVEIKRVRKRGRKPKNGGIGSIQEIRKRFEKEENDKVIFSSSTGKDIKTKNDNEKTQISLGNLNITMRKGKTIDREELRSMFKKPEKKIFKQEPPPAIYISESESECTDTTSNNNNKPICKCQTNKPEKKLVTVEKKKTYRLLTTITKHLEDSKTWPTQTKILCWWCCHKFDTQPIPTVLNHEKDMYKLSGIFCSWNCSLAYLLSKSKISYPLVRFYKEWTGKKYFNIKPSPSKYILKSFGGYMSINEYRSQSTHKTKQIFISTEHVSFINQDILEITKKSQLRKQKKLALKRKKAIPTRNTLIDTKLKN